MPTKKNTGHYHIWDLPKNVFPRTKGNKAKEYANDIGRLYTSLAFTETKLQYSGQISTFNIRSITKKSGYTTSKDEVFESIEKFVYHYENYCYRAFSLREKLIHFLNAVLPVGYPDNEVSIKSLLINPTIKSSGLLTDLKKFNGQQALGKIISDRNSLTHRLYYHEKFDHYLRPANQGNKKQDWFIDWRKQIETHINRANTSMAILTRLNHEIAQKIIAYKVK